MSRAWDGSPRPADAPPQPARGTTKPSLEDVWLVARYVFLFIVPSAVFAVLVLRDLF